MIAITSLSTRDVDEKNEQLSISDIKKKLTTKFIGQNIDIFATIDSTNLYLKHIESEKLKTGYVVIANEQTNGKGQKNRAFISEKSSGIYMSILLKIDVAKQDIRLLTVCAALAVSQAIETTYSLAPGIKWVNDIFLNGKKICGILAEGKISTESQKLSTIIVGIGINTSPVAPEIYEIATSIEEALDVSVNRNELIAAVLNQFEEVFDDYVIKNKNIEIIKKYENRLFILGKKVFVKQMQKQYVAIVRGVDETGALIVEKENGSLCNINSGEIELFC